MRHQLIDTEDNSAVMVCGDILSRSIQQIMLNMKESYKNSKFSIESVKFIVRKIIKKEEIGHKARLKIVYGEKIYFIETKPIQPSFLHNFLLLNVTRGENRKECRIEKVPPEIINLKKFLLDEVMIKILLIM